MRVRFWRKVHRWVGFPAALFLIFAAITGFVLAFTEFFGAEEALREATRDQVSPMTLSAAAASWQDPVMKAVASANRLQPGAPVDKLELQFKGAQPTATLYTGKPHGGEDRKLVFALRSGALLRNEEYLDKPFLTRLHSGEAFGDGGLVFAMFWALALAILASSGLYIYFTMRGTRVRTGARRVFW